jgi:hypothetical protein
LISDSDEDTTPASVLPKTQVCSPCLNMRDTYLQESSLLQVRWKSVTGKWPWICRIHKDYLFAHHHLQGAGSDVLYPFVSHRGIL